jgi:hypothetical protein
MSLKDKLEIGLKPDAPFRKDNLPDFQKDDPACDEGATPSDSSAVERARKDCTMPPVKQEQLAKERAVAEERALADERARADEHEPNRRIAPRRPSSGR